uniref:Retrotransposon Copia-like N-terminal domain-containing protein n=1 Tax=Tanacetum cinerariifolium TaxID=118510 RepID=A0A6L2MJE3_TANCI|nr:hypothetical protein [Tanacetum cinerariifolium]
MSGDDDTPSPGGGAGGSSASEASKLTYGDELYLHSNDSSIRNFFNIKLKGTENYNVWSCAMTLALSTKNKTGFINYVKTAFSLISREESHRCSFSSSAGTKVYVFATKSHNNNTYNKKNQSKNPNVIFSNPNCGHPGHSIIIPKDPQIILPTTIAFHHLQSPASLTTQLTPEQIQQLINLLNSKPPKNVQANMAGTLFCSNSKTFYKVYKTDKGWIIDSGANQHMVTSLDNLENVVDISDLNHQIDYPNEYTINLLSVHKLARDSKLSIGFDEYNCYIQDLHMKKTIGTGNQQGDALTNDDAETESQGDDRELSVSDSINNSISDSLDNDATTNDIAHLPTDDNIWNLDPLLRALNSITIRNQFPIPMVDETLELNDQANEAFINLKAAMTTLVVLVLPNFSVVFDVPTDASSMGIRDLGDVTTLFGHGLKPWHEPDALRLDGKGTPNSLDT